jgi:small subunit ribosomal protein S21
MRALRRVAALRRGSFPPAERQFKPNRRPVWTFQRYSVTGRGKVAHAVNACALQAFPGTGFNEPTAIGARVQVLVRDNNVDQALKALKKKMQREGIFREMKLRGHYEKPSEKKAREKAEAIRRARKLARKRMQREGLLPMKPKVIPGAAGGRGGPPRAPRFG